MNLQFIGLVCLISGLLLAVTFSSFLRLLSPVDSSSSSSKKNKVLNYVKIILYGAVLPGISVALLYYSGFMSTSISFGGFDNDQNILVGNPGF